MCWFLSEIFIFKPFAHHTQVVQGLFPDEFWRGFIREKVWGELCLLKSQADGNTSVEEIVVTTIVEHAVGIDAGNFHQV